MKQLIFTFGFLLFVTLVSAQGIDIETESVTIDNFISFIVNKIEPKEVDSENASHFTFLLQTSLSGITNEDKVILKQAFKLIADRLTESDYISILTYSGFSGTALMKTTPKDLKSILYTLEHLKSSVKDYHKSGIEHAYTYAEEHYVEDAKNTIVMVRNPNATRSTEASVVTTDNAKKGNNVALITAIALLPELISVIKD